MSNKLEVAAEVEEKDTTNFGSAGWSEMIGGLASTKISGEGQWEAADASKVDNAQWSGLGGVGPWTACPNGSNVNDVAWLTNALTANYQLGGSVGDVAPWTAEASSSWAMPRGRVGHPPGTARTATGNGTAVQLPAVAAGQYLYASLHVLSVSGTSSPTLTVTIGSDDSAGFASPVTRITFNAATARGGQIMRAVGPITDTWYRASWTISGTTPSFLFLVAFGVK
ncbi:hypothetical protein [Lentzea albida]|uniref:hypothetical protein n=1 Tax=Lentzea albida TaxID=65499 RepID=UPI001FE516A7|nr:hypothetical protein [Lentzea albida]